MVTDWVRVPPSTVPPTTTTTTEPPSTTTTEPPYASFTPVSSDPAVALFAGLVVFLLLVIAVQSLRRN